MTQIAKTETPSLHMLLTEILSRLRSIEGRLGAPPARPLKPGATLTYPGLTPEGLRAEIAKRIRAYYDAHELPYQLYKITRIFGRQVRALGLTTDALLAPLVPGTLARVETDRGAFLFVPAEAWSALPAQQRTFWMTASEDELRKDAADRRYALDALDADGALDETAKTS